MRHNHDMSPRGIGRVQPWLPTWSGIVGCGAQEGPVLAIVVALTDSYAEDGDLAKVPAIVISAGNEDLTAR